MLRKYVFTPATAFFIALLIVGMAINSSSKASAQKLYESQIAACQRGNSLRQESNARAGDHEAELGVVRDFLSAASAARMAAYERGHQESDLIAARQYTDQLHRLQGIKFGLMPLIDCQSAIKHP